MKVICLFVAMDKCQSVLILQVLVLGQPGEEVSLELILRVVADVGLVVSIHYFLLSLCVSIS